MGDGAVARRPAGCGGPKRAADRQPHPGAGVHPRETAACSGAARPGDAQNRFQLVFLQVPRCVSPGPEHPLALFLDDLQWLDAATLELLEKLITDPDVRHLMLVGAYRDNEVRPLSHPVMRTLGAIRKAERACRRSR